MAGMTLSELLKKMIEMGGSDLHISTNSPPTLASGANQRTVIQFYSNGTNLYQAAPAAVDVQ